MNFDVIPAELKARAQWVCWREEIRDGKPTKPPIIPGTNEYASTNKPDTWRDFNSATASLNGHGGVGFVLTRGLGVCGIDLDHCVDAAGKLAPYAIRISERLNSYTERSPNDGIHILVRSSLPQCHKIGWLEMFDRGKYFTMTGQHIPGTPVTIEQADIGWLFRLMTARTFDFQNNPKLKGLMSGQWESLYPSQSEADLSLCSMLAGLGLNDSDVDNGFRLSGLYREKWEREDYRTATIQTALQSTGKPITVTSGIAPTSGITSPFSEDEIAKRFVETHGASVRYSPEMGGWLFWDGKVWQRDSPNLVTDIVRDTCRQFAIMADTIKMGRGRALASYRTVKAVMNLAASDPTLTIMMEELDTNPWSICCQNGEIDLRTGELLKHDRQHFMTKIVSAALAEPGTPAPRWSGFLKLITNGDADLQNYLQRIAGCCLTGISAEVLFFFHGHGGNGKGVFTSTVSGILDSYTKTAPPATFLDSITDQHPTDLAGLCGARLVLANEVEKGRRWNEAKIKSLTGGDKVAAHFMRQDFFEYTPTFKLIISGNHRPALRSVNEAIRRRMHLVPFTCTIPAAERDSQFSEKLKPEWPAILRWMLDGCLAWQAQGLKPPAIASEATKEYLSEENATERWIEERCTLKPVFTPIAVLFDDWKEWAESRGEYVGSIKSFSQSLEAVEGIARHRTPATRGFRGIELRGGYHPPEFKGRGN
ncbi:MAG: phage/plasmid primase, P4 family [Terriglobales bacterium]